MTSFTLSGRSLPTQAGGEGTSSETMSDSNVLGGLDINLRGFEVILSPRSYSFQDHPLDIGQITLGSTIMLSLLWLGF
jgi:hypothetical protein